MNRSKTEQMKTEVLNSNESKISVWDYEISVNKMKSLILNWRNISIEILDELNTARNNLSSQGIRNDLSEEKMGWENYLNDVGLSKSTVNRWLRKYDPDKRKILEKSTVIESVVLPKELEGDVKSKINTKNNCPHCGYCW